MKDIDGVVEKYLDGSISSLVQEYYEIFYLGNDNDYWGSVFKTSLRFMLLLNILQLLVFLILNFLIEGFVTFFVDEHFIYFLCYTFFLQLVCLFLRFNKPSIDDIYNRLTTKYNFTFEFDSNNKYQNLNRLEVEWINQRFESSTRLNEVIQAIKEYVSSNTTTSRNFEFIFINILKNKYIVNIFSIFLTVVLTISLNPISNSINDSNFKELFTVFILLSLMFWVILIGAFILIKLFFLFFELSIENTEDGYSYVPWRCELLINMLSKYQKSPNIKKELYNKSTNSIQKKQHAWLERISKN